MSVACLLGALVFTAFFKGPQADAAGQESPGEAPVTVWHIPHPDDEVLGMAGGIMAAHAAGRRNVVVLYTQGGNSDVRLVLNGVFYCHLHGRYHDPSAEGYHPLDLEAFKAARVAESRAALKALGVADHDVIVLDFPDGGLETAPVLEVMQELDRRFPGAQHRTTSVTDKHRDHKVLARALYRLKEHAASSGRALDIAFYRVYQHGHSAVGQRAGAAREMPASFTVVDVDDPELKRAALAEFARWEPAAGHYAIGLHSVPKLISRAADAPYEYQDRLDARLLWSLRQSGSLGFDVFLQETALNYRIAPGWKFQVSTPYTIDTVRSALVYERRWVSAAIVLFAGYGMEWTEAGVEPYALAGMNIVDSIVVKYRPPRSRQDVGSSVQIGWKLKI